MPLNTYLNKILNESTDTDDEFNAVTEIYEDGDNTDEPEWDDTFSKLESVKRVRVIRNGIPITIVRSTIPGYKIVYKKGTGASPDQRKMSFAERRARERAADRTYEKRKRHQSDRQQAKRKASIEKRKDFGLDRVEEE